jgi:hypothetical protein
LSNNWRRNGDEEASNRVGVWSVMGVSARCGGKCKDYFFMTHEKPC